MAFCPWLDFNRRFVKLQVRFPTACKCAARCPLPVLAGLSSQKEEEEGEREEERERED